MAEVIIPKPGTIYNEYICQGSDDNYYVKRNNQWVKVGGSSENINPLDPRVTTAIPAATKGDKFYVVADGIIGEEGKDPIKLEKGDMLVCIKTTPGGIAADYDVLQKSFELSDYLKANDTENYNPFYLYKHFESLQIVDSTYSGELLDPIGLIILKSDITTESINLNSLASVNPKQRGVGNLIIMNQSLTVAVTIIPSGGDKFVDYKLIDINPYSISGDNFISFKSFFINNQGFIMQGI